MAAPPIYLGDNRSLVTLSTGEVICVDTGSIDAIRYLIGAAETCHDLRLFRRFLTRESTVVDVGANFGLFTAVAAKVVKDSGRLFSIEANPYTFECLRRTVYANWADTNPRIVLKNAAASDRSGKVLLRFLPDELGGATVVRPFSLSERERQAEVDSIVLDEFLPADAQVDLVKIDAEGSEPVVLRGMEGIIKRSPNIRIIVEYIEHMIAQATHPHDMLNYVRSLGFAVCLILPDAKFKIIDPSDVPPDDCYLFFTRTPDQDLHPSVFQISPSDLRYLDRYKIGDRNVLLDNDTGVLVYDSRSQSAIGVDLLFYGPYIDIPTGAYELTFNGRLVGPVGIRITYNFGGAIVHECEVSDFERPVAFSIREEAKNFEVVMSGTPNLEFIELWSMTLNHQPNS